MIEYLPLVLTGIGIIASIIYYANILNNANKTRELQLRAQEHATETRQAQLYMQLFQVDTSTEYQRKVYDLLLLDTTDSEKIGKRFETERDFAANVRSFLFRIDGIGNLLKTGLIDHDYVYNIGAGIGPIIAWYNWKPWISYYRESRNSPDYLTGLEFYAEEMIKIRQAKGYPFKWSSELKKFL